MNKDRKIEVLEGLALLHRNRIKALEPRRERLKVLIAQHQESLDEVEKEIEEHRLVGEVLAQGAEQLASWGIEDNCTRSH